MFLVMHTKDTRSPCPLVLSHSPIPPPRKTAVQFSESEKGLFLAVVPLGIATDAGCCLIDQIGAHLDEVLFIWLRFLIHLIPVPPQPPPQPIEAHPQVILENHVGGFVVDHLVQLTLVIAVIATLVVRENNQQRFVFFLRAGVDLHVPCSTSHSVVFGHVVISDMQLHFVDGDLAVDTSVEVAVSLDKCVEAKLGCCDTFMMGDCHIEEEWVTPHPSNTHNAGRRIWGRE
ncbi:hypothetical protein EYF80_012146 [Liparis tanakae]|uniref:Uncharacterized protein n=1 Tax=Liparis tanakae TaxID=230148 RepID=A0A4Z2IHZ7_9TELE|nr:hypothetical protein EYF80_012146 [Liparis tanakae]